MTPIESAVRSRARNQAYRVEKSRKALSLDNAGDFQLVDISRNLVVLGARYDATVADIAEYLAEAV